MTSFVGKSLFVVDINSKSAVQPLRKKLPMIKNPAIFAMLVTLSTAKIMAAMIIIILVD